MRPRRDVSRPPGHGVLSAARGEPGESSFGRLKTSLTELALYFLLIGWWFSAIWIVLAWLIAVTIIGLPVAQWMFLRVNAILTLQRMN